MINWNSVPSLFVGGNWNGNASLEQEWECRRQLVPETRAEPIRINGTSGNVFSPRGERTDSYVAAIPIKMEFNVAVK